MFKKNIFLNINYIFFFFIALFSTFLIFGFDLISITNTQWIHNTSSDLSQSHIGWYFFKNDIWRFPLGNNPNYGDEFGNSIIFSDSIPILALFFKFISPIMPENFHYFSIWYFICFLLQLYFSHKVLFYFTNNNNFSLVGSLFFLIAPIFILRMSLHPALAGHWILLLTINLCLTKSYKDSKLSWIFTIILSSLIQWYFTVIISIIFILLRAFDVIIHKEKLLRTIKDLMITFLCLLFVMYIVGYFEVRTVDGLGLGYGAYKLNLLSIIDPTIYSRNETWSWILPNIELSDAEDIEGFSYLGLGQILMILIALSTFIKNISSRNLISLEESKNIKIFFYISFILTLLALSNKISFGSYTLIEIPLNKFIYAALSLMRSAGRLFWIVYYFIVFLSLIIIFRSFALKHSIFLVTILLIIQIADISAGLKNYIKLNNLTKNIYVLKDKIWIDISKKYKIVKTSYPKSYNPLFVFFSNFYEEHSINKTNLIKIARANRSLVAQARYDLYQKFNNKDLEPDTIYVAGNLGHLINLKNIFKNDDVGFFFRDNLWIFIKNEKNLMNSYDLAHFKKIKPNLLEINKKKKLYFTDNVTLGYWNKKQENYFGFGWSHNFRKQGAWSDGNLATLLFTLDKNLNNKVLEIECEPYITKKNKTLDMDIYINGKFNKTINFNYISNSKKEKISILLESESINNEVKIDFIIKNPASPLELLQSPDSRKLGILVKNLELKEI